MRIDKVLIAIAAAGLAVPTLAAAAPAGERSASKATKYCLTYEARTGSKIRETQCLTKAQWAQRGIDVDELLRK